MSKVYVALSGCGKSEFCQVHEGWIDFDQKTYNEYKQKGTSFENLKIMSNPFLNFEECFKAENTIPILIMPGTDMKEEILRRVYERNPQDPWALEYRRIYDKFYADLNSRDLEKIYLQPGQYIDDIIDENGDLKS